MALRGRRIDDFFERWSIVASGGLKIGESSTSFPKSNINYSL
jgi:hypothetical protein